jgi:hypothetical protein
VRIFLIVAFAVAATAVASNDDKTSRQSLKGIKEFYVLVEPLHQEVEQKGLTESLIRTEVELKLRQAGIRIVPLDEGRKISGRPYLYVNTNVYRDTSGLWNFNIDLGVWQAVRLDRDTSIQLDAPTWSVSAIGLVGADKVGGIRNQINDYTDRFINAYLSVNPR